MFSPQKFQEKNHFSQKKVIPPRFLFKEMPNNFQTRYSTLLCYQTNSQLLEWKHINTVIKTCLITVWWNLTLSSAGGRSLILDCASLGGISTTNQYTSLKHTPPAALVDVHLLYMVNCSYYIEEDSSHLMSHTLKPCYFGFLFSATLETRVTIWLS